VREPALSSETGGRPATAWQARLLLRAAQSAALGTIGDDGLPSVSLVTPATAPDLSVIMLLSSLSEHRRNLERDDRCGLMVTGAAASPNAQTAPRLSLSGRASPAPPAEAPNLRRRFLAAHPYAANYAAFGDFALWWFVLERAQFVGGFARAHRLSPEELCPAPDAVLAIAAEEAALLAEWGPAGAERIALATGGAPGAWRLVAVDPDGCHLATEAASLRVPFATTASTAQASRAALAELASVTPNP
jgi:putative heme iron utilization protein